MQLAMTVLAVVLAVTVVVGVIGFMIDRSAARHERSEGR